MTSFAMDMPHRDSTFKAQFNKKMNTTSSMDVLYRNFQKELKEQYNSNFMIPICANPKNVNIYSYALIVCYETY